MEIYLLSISVKLTTKNRYIYLRNDVPICIVQGHNNRTTQFGEKNKFISLKELSRKLYIINQIVWDIIWNICNCVILYLLYRTRWNGYICSASLANINTISTCSIKHLSSSSPCVNQDFYPLVFMLLFFLKLSYLWSGY